jgi:hypothetical protein
MNEYCLGTFNTRGKNFLSPLKYRLSLLLSPIYPLSSIFKRLRLKATFRYLKKLRTKLSQWHVVLLEKHTDI